MSKGLWAYAPKISNKRMKLNTQAAKHLIKKIQASSNYWGMPDWQAQACISPLKLTDPSNCRVGGNMNCKGKDHRSPLDLGLHIWNTLLEVGWLILTCLNEPVGERNPRKESLSLLKYTHLTFSNLTYHFDWWFSLLEFLTLSLSALWLKQLPRGHIALNQWFSTQRWSYIPSDIWKCLETVLIVTTRWGGKQEARGHWVFTKL